MLNQCLTQGWCQELIRESVTRLCVGSVTSDEYTSGMFVFKIELGGWSLSACQIILLCIFFVCVGGEGICEYWLWSKVNPFYFSVGVSDYLWRGLNEKYLLLQRIEGWAYWTGFVLGESVLLCRSWLSVYGCYAASDFPEWSVVLCSFVRYEFLMKSV